MTDAAPAFSPRVVVAGLWHLGTVTAACVAEAGWPVLAVDPDPEIVGGLSNGTAPLFEPGLDDLLAERREAHSLDVGMLDDPRIGAAAIVWVTFDTPVDDEDRADVESVLGHACAVLGHAGKDALVVVSSQLPVGSTAELQSRMSALGRADLRYAYVPENLRLGRAIETFRASDRFVAGARSAGDREQLGELLGRFAERVEWMGVESAEMTKHALNAFLATSVAFINEVAGICERVGADAHEVARGLKSEHRIGPRAYLSPGDAFAGETLARDISFLVALAEREGVAAEVARGVAASNDDHRRWARRTLLRVLAADSATSVGLSGRRIAIWGLTYKPGTDTLRRSSALELGRWLGESGAHVRAYDPMVSALPESEYPAIEMAGSEIDAARDAEALVVCTPWPQFQDVDPSLLLNAMATPLILDAGGHLRAGLAADRAFRYVRVGSAT